MRSLAGLLGLLILIAGCGQAPSAPPESPGDVIWTGSLRVEGWVELEEGGVFHPDSIGVVLDGDSLGMFANPDTLEGVPEGNHSVKIYGECEGLVYLSAGRTIFIAYNEVALLSTELLRTGAVLVSASARGFVLDSVNVKLDGDTLGIGGNPRLIVDVPSGEHKLTLFTTVAEVELEGWRRGVRVAVAETSVVELEMVAVAPDSGSHAPDIGGLDLDGTPWSLSDHWGEVTYLYFFEHT